MHQAQDQSHRRAILIFFGVVILSALISFLFFFIQLKHQDQHLAGVVVSSGSGSLVISDARGEHFTISMSSSTEVFDGRSSHKSSIDALTKGTFIQVFGDLGENQNFSAKTIRVMQRR